MIINVNQNNFKDTFKFEPGIISVAGFYGSGVKFQVLNKLFEEYKNNNKLRAVIFDGECCSICKYVENNKIATRHQIIQSNIDVYEGLHKDFSNLIKGFMKTEYTIFIINRPQLKTTEDKLDFCKKVEDLKDDLIKNNSCIVILDVLQSISSNDYKAEILPVGKGLRCDKTYILKEER